MFGCAKRNVKQAIDKPSVAALKQLSALPACDCSPTQSITKNLPIKELEPSVVEPAKNEQAKVAEYNLLKPAKWEDIDGFQEDDLTGAWGAWLQSCNTLKNKQNINQAVWHFAIQFSVAKITSTFYGI